MKQFIDGIFNILAILFDKIPVLNKLKGFRSVAGLLGLAVVAVLKAKGIGSPELMSGLEIGFIGLTTLALNAKGREQ